MSEYCGRQIGSAQRGQLKRTGGPGSYAISLGFLFPAMSMLASFSGDVNCRVEASIA